MTLRGLNDREDRVFSREDQEFGFGKQDRDGLKHAVDGGRQEQSSRSVRHQNKAAS